VIYLIPIAARGFLKAPHNEEDDAHIRAIRKQHPWVIIPPVLTAMGAFILFFFAGALFITISTQRLGTFLGVGPCLDF